MTRPNILFITSDQQHWNTIGKHFPEVKTPNLDRLANDGLLFTRAYCPNPTCTPTRASLITGQFPSQHGAWALGTKLPETATTIGELLQAEGYDSSLIGKAHFQPLESTDEYSSLESYPLLRDLDFWRGFNGPFYGFNHVELARNHCDEAHVGQHYALWMEEKGLPDWKDHFQNKWGPFDFTDGKPNVSQRHAWTLPEEYHYDNWITERSIARMDHCRENDKPFFVWASYFDPHPPYLVPEPWASMYDPADVTVPQAMPGEHENSAPYIQETQKQKPNFDYPPGEGNWNHGMGSHLQDRDDLAKDIAVYYGMISMMDHYIGKLLDYLDETGQRENTLIVFTTDHGHFYGHHGLNAKGPFHYEDEIRVPMIASWPGQIPAGVETAALQSLVDIPVSFLKAVGAPVPNDMQGVDQLRVWRGEADSVRDHCVVEFRQQPTAIHLKTYVNERYKLTVYYNKPYGELFDLQEDPGEYRNLWNDPEAANLKAELMQKLVFAEMGKEPMWMPRIAGA
ncbi:sulfatase family protein [Cerasicoccus arenae]|uniref:Sulfatase n=1 Tax=Cerasicoccus arenae TaxID=424488 RepID=A0A8J3DJW4_9BACT|nr:sulfatase-like hydrolase/transferase [Cerasicoccus arenae]MBK1856645.1 sulfatase-like hydrolase/transferase [Cerasicoccus arenae]GHC12256.1 sulfatase [Cerasicoccus arenae]